MLNAKMLNAERWPLYGRYAFGVKRSANYVFLAN
jgi:hypothetical protein